MHIIFIFQFVKIEFIIYTTMKMRIKLKEIWKK